MDFLYLTEEGYEMLLEYLKMCPILSQAIIVRDKMLAV